VNAVDQQRIATPTSRPTTPPTIDNTQVLIQKLQDNTAASRADRATDADLFGPFRDRGQHDVHDAMPPTAG
jgi:hypothetical protein